MLEAHFERHPSLPTSHSLPLHIQPAPVPNPHSPTPSAGFARAAPGVQGGNGLLKPGSRQGASASRGIVYTVNHVVVELALRPITTRKRRRQRRDRQQRGFQRRVVPWGRHRTSGDAREASPASRARG